MATIYNSSFHYNRIQICETRLNFYDIVSIAFKIYRRSLLSTCSTWRSVAEDSAGNLPLFRNNKELNELLSWLPWKYFFPL